MTLRGAGFDWPSILRYIKQHQFFEQSFHIPPDELLAAARQHERYIDHLLDQRLRNGETPTKEYAHYLDSNYSRFADWLYTTLINVAEQYRTTAESLAALPPRNPDEFHALQQLDRDARLLSRILGEARFHLLQRFAQTNWVLLMLPKRPTVAAADLLATFKRLRGSIGREAVDLAELRSACQRLAEMGHAASESLIGAIDGTLAELDIAIELAQISLDHSNAGIIAIPAPGRFEHGAGMANADFLLFDLPAQRMLGVQVKTKDKWRITRQYDRLRVTVIFAVADANSYRFEHGKRVPAPGSTSLRSLAVASYDDLLGSHLSKSEFKDYRKRAEALLPQLISPEGQAMNMIAQATSDDDSATGNTDASTYKKQRKMKMRREQAKLDKTVNELVTHLLYELHRS